MSEERGALKSKNRFSLGPANEFEGQWSILVETDGVVGHLDLKPKTEIWTGARESQTVTDGGRMHDHGHKHPVK